MQFLYHSLFALALYGLSPARNWATLAQESSPAPCAVVFNSSDYYQPAADAYNCLISTPFNRTLATNLVSYWKDTLQFQSTLAYLKDPPPGYQQPPVDIIGGLDLIQDQIDNGAFSNQYAFEAVVQSLLQRSHDFHLDLFGGVMRVFAFTPNVVLSTVSVDGLALPRVYIGEDLYEWYTDAIEAPPSPIDTINGEIAEKFITDYGARNSYGAIEPHGDWNQMMFTYSAAIQGYTDPFSTPFYPGEKLVITFDNGTTTEYPWYAVYVGGSDAPWILDGQDLFDWFVLGIDTQSDIKINGPPSTTTAIVTAADATATETNAVASETSSAATPSSTAETYPGWGLSYPAYPDVIQPELGIDGVLTGYFLQDSKIGVLSIPSFSANDDVDTVRNFTDTVEYFLTQAKEAGMTRILVDLQNNRGGDALLARATFRRFFPGVDTFSGMRTRSSDKSDVLGNTMTNYYLQNNQSMSFTRLEMFANNPWAVSNEINAGTNQNFTSWAEYFGPHPDKNDGFSTVFRYNFSNPIFVLSAGGIDAFAEPSPDEPAPYDPKDIAILTDSVCGSTCDLFVEMMHHEMGIRTVVVGGLPQEGPMQARGSTRGALALNNFDVDVNLAFAAAVNTTTNQTFVNRDPSYGNLMTMAFNLADQIRVNEYVPLQFAYEAADCRIFFTPDTYFNYTLLWEYAASAIFFNASTCVARSAEHNNTMQTDIYGPSSEQLEAWAQTNRGNAPSDDQFTISVAADAINFWIGFNRDQFPIDIGEIEPCLNCGGLLETLPNNSPRTTQEQTNDLLPQTPSNPGAAQFRLAPRSTRNSPFSRYRPQQPTSFGPNSRPPSTYVPKTPTVARPISVGALKSRGDRRERKPWSVLGARTLRTRDRRSIWH